jgi:hypothetical protein
MIVRTTARGVLATVAVVVFCLLAACAPAFASGAEEPWWHLTMVASPSVLPPGGFTQIQVMAVNVGNGDAEGASAPIVLGGKLPAGLVAIGIESQAGFVGSHGRGECSLAALSCTFRGPNILPYEPVNMTLTVRVEPSVVPGVVDAEAFVEGGGASRVRLVHPLSVGTEPTPFGVQALDLVPESFGGATDTQAGSHPFQMTSTVDLNLAPGRTVSAESQAEEEVAGGSFAKDVHLMLPQGLVGDPTQIPECTTGEYDTRTGLLGFVSHCPDDSVIGVAVTTVILPEAEAQPIAYPSPVYNLVPQVGEPARFGYNVLGSLVTFDTLVRTGGDYGVDVDVNNISQVAQLLGSEVTFWGVPADQRHNLQRGVYCLQNGEHSEHERPCAPLNESVTPPLLTLPTSCTVPWTTSVTADSWLHQTLVSGGEYALHDEFGHALGLTGCNRLSFEPSIIATPDGQAGSTPTGLTVDVHVPQEASLDPTGASQSAVQSTTVTLPPGVALNPSGADGLSSCGESAVGLESPEEQTCPESAKVGTVEIHTPLLPNPIVGAAYLATQNANPFGSLVALYIVARDPQSGVLVKIPGQVTPNPVTGQLVSTFPNTPELPFEDLALNFFGGSRAPLVTPALCGTYTSTASFTPWSGNPPAESSSEFNITGGPNGKPCSDPLPFHPSLQGGSTNIQTGTFSQFTTTMSREDGEQPLDAIQLHMPEGLIGSLSEVKLCGEEQANAGTCGPESLIGTTTVSVGEGTNPYTVNGGEVFITGPYEGAPFGLSIVNPAKAGPFNLGKIVVRAKIEVDPLTSALTITTNQSGPGSIPQLIDGIPLEIRHVNVLINRQRFVFNPSNCTPTTITGSLTSSEGTVSALSVPFQVTNCATLEFKPKFSVETSGKTSKADGAGLVVKLTYPIAEGQANIKKVKVELPKQLPSRLTTLQKACTEATFDANPESCPAASRIGEAVATTPVIAGDFTGPAYFVSHGHAKFPELVVVLTGEDGVKVDLHGETFINSQGITSSTFPAIPDVPVGSFELKLPQGPYSALAAVGNLCKSKLTMPTEFVAQNGAVIQQSTKVAVTGCPKAKQASHKKKGKRKASHKKKQKGKRGKQGKGGARGGSRKG